MLDRGPAPLLAGGRASGGSPEGGGSPDLVVPAAGTGACAPGCTTGRFAVPCRPLGDAPGSGGAGHRVAGESAAACPEGLCGRRVGVGGSVGGLEAVARVLSVERFVSLGRRWSPTAVPSTDAPAASRWARARRAEPASTQWDLCLRGRDLRHRARGLSPLGAGSGHRRGRGRGLVQAGAVGCALTFPGWGIKHPRTGPWPTSSAQHGSHRTAQGGSLCRGCPDFATVPNSERRSNENRRVGRDCRLDTGVARSA